MLCMSRFESDKQLPEKVFCQKAAESLAMVLTAGLLMPSALGIELRDSVTFAH